MFVVKVTVFCCLFGFPLVLNLTFTSPVSPGLIGSLGHKGTVQPQDAFAFVMTKSVFPELVTTQTINLATTGDSGNKNASLNSEETGGITKNATSKTNSNENKSMVICGSY